ncbi:MAG TPA: hypothetical protein VLE02_01200 [Nitrosarchaeum sp.]|nr:hypothetical protein [Nitrosarchaeum sp.]
MNYFEVTPAEIIKFIVQKLHTKWTLNFISTCKDFQYLLQSITKVSGNGNIDILKKMGGVNHLLLGICTLDFMHISHLKLETLGFKGEVTEKMNDTLVKMTSLHTLHLISHSNINLTSLQNLPLTRLTFLSDTNCSNNMNNGFTSLKELHIGGPDVTDNMIYGITRLTSLTFLKLHGSTNLHGFFVPFLANLKTLNLKETAISPSVMWKNQTFLTNLTTLILPAHPLSEGGYNWWYVLLLQLRNLKGLSITNEKFLHPKRINMLLVDRKTSEKVYVRVPILTGLRYLNLGPNKTCSDEDLSDLTKLRVLKLGCNEKITALGINKLHLEQLYVGSNTNDFSTCKGVQII